MNNGYTEFQRIMAELNYKIKYGQDPPTDDSTLKYLKDLFGI